MSKARFNLKLGQAIEFDGRLLRYRNRGRDRDRLLIFEGLDGVPLSISDSALLIAQIRGDLRFLTEAEMEARIEEPSRARIMLADGREADGNETRRRLDYVRAWENAGRPPLTKEGLAPVAEVEFERRRERARAGDTVLETCPPSARTLQRWISMWRKSDGDIEALVPQKGNRGNCSEKLQPNVLEIVERVVEENYLVDQRPTVAVVHKAVVTAICEFNRPLLPEDKVPTPSHMATYRAIAKIDPFTKDCCRYGALEANKRWRPVMSAPASVRHNEVWEIDHTKVDLIVLDEESGLPIGRPYATVIIDRYSRMIMGFTIGFEPPGVRLVHEALTHAIHPKEVNPHPDHMLKHWPAFGTPEVLVTDQGREFKSVSFRESCLSLGFDVQYTPVLKAWYKGRIERFFRTLALDVFHRVPGTTFSNIFERNGEIPPERVAVATLNELRDHFERYITEIYQHRRHRGLLGRSPRQLWDESVERHGMRALPNPDDISRAMSQVVWRRPQRQGIEVNGLLYNSGDVAAYRVSEVRKEPVKVLLNPRDLTKISFYEPNIKRFLDVPIQNGLRHLVEGVPLHKHLLARALQRENPDVLGGSDGLARSYTLLDKSMSGRSSASGATNRAKAARLWEAMTKMRTEDDAAPYDMGAGADPLLEGLLDVGSDSLVSSVTTANGDPVAPRAPAAPPAKAAPSKPDSGDKRKTMVIRPLPPRTKCPPEPAPQTTPPPIDDLADDLRFLDSIELAKGLKTRSSDNKE